MAKKKSAPKKAPAPCANKTPTLPITLIAEMPRGGQCCSGLAFSNEGTFLAAWAGDRQLHLYDVAAGKRLLCLSEHSGGIDGVSFSPDSRLLASVGERKVNRRNAGGELLVWNVEAGKLLHRITFLPKKVDLSIGPALFAPTGKHVVCVVLDYDDDEAQILIADPHAGKLIGEIPLDDETCELAFAPDGKTLAGVFNDKLVLWQFPSGKQGKVIKRTERATALDCSPDGKTIAVASANGTVTLYDAATGKAGASLQESPQHSVAQVQFSADGQQLATIGQTMHGDSQGEVRIWEVKSRQVLLGFPGRTGVEPAPRGFPGACALTPNFSLFANAGGKVRLWQVNTEST